MCLLLSSCFITNLNLSATAVLRETKLYKLTFYREFFGPTLVHFSVGNDVMLRKDHIKGRVLSTSVFYLLTLLSPIQVNGSVAMKGNCPISYKLTSSSHGDFVLDKYCFDDSCWHKLLIQLPDKVRSYRWHSARLQQLQCVSNRVTAVLR